jgi:hypothetical protein
MSQYAVYADNAAAADRATFIRKTYLHVAGSVGALVLLETLLLNSPIAASLTSLMLTGKWSWLIVLGAFFLVTNVAEKMASSATSIGGQYAGLGLYIVAETLILCPMLLIASAYADGIIMQAALITVGMFIGLTWIAFTTKKDFTFMGGFLKIAGMVAMGAIVASIAFGFTMGLFFSAAMILLVGGTILYQTSNVMLHFNTNQHVAASLTLFASIATMFWYVLRLLMSSRD